MFLVSAPGRLVVPLLLYPLPGTHQTLCGPYFRDTLALRCFGWYTFVIPMRLYASQGILWGLSCLFGCYRFSLDRLGFLLVPSWLRLALSWSHLTVIWCNFALSPFNILSSLSVLASRRLNFAVYWHSLALS